MKHIKTYEGLFDFFKRKKREKQIPFERSLINLQKFLDTECPDKISSSLISIKPWLSPYSRYIGLTDDCLITSDIIINEVTLEDRIGERGLSIGNRHSKFGNIEDISRVTIPISKSADPISLSNNGDTFNNQTNTWVPEVLGTVLIKLKTDDDNYISITLGYNQLKKIDMITWMSMVISNGKIYGSIELGNNSGSVNGTLYGKIQDYLIENKLIGQVI